MLGMYFLVGTKDDSKLAARLHVNLNTGNTALELNKVSETHMVSTAMFLMQP